MAASVQWFDPAQKIVYQHLTTGITYNDLLRNTTLIYDMIGSQPHRVDVVIELECSMSELMSVGLFQFLQQANPLVAPNTGRLVVVGQTFMAQSLMPVARVIAPHIARRVYYEDSVVEAVYALYQMNHDHLAIEPYRLHA